MRKLIAGNWKMNGLRADGSALARDLAARAGKAAANCDLLVCPPATLLTEIAAVLTGSRIALGGQDCHAQARGAFTGDVSAAMLKDAGCLYVILGHSERRRDHHESDALIRAKVETARAEGLIPIVCIGENADEREKGNTLGVLDTQLGRSLPEGLRGNDLIVAYEPTWAIGSGVTPKEHEIAQAHAFIRRELGRRVADPNAVRILYGGSVNSANAAAVLGIANVDGALVGGASLDANSFWAIAEAAGV
jgi:triosephosphate isomerase (TIM)